MQKLLFIGFLAIAATGCSKYIDEPDNSTLTTGMLFNSTRDLDNLLYGGYGALGNATTLSGNWRMFPEVLADQVVVNVAEPTSSDPYTFLYNRQMKQALYTDNYQQAYIAIQNANTVLYAVDNGLITKEKDPEFNDIARGRVTGEAYFIRGVAHFELVRLYAHQYGYQSNQPNSGIVLKTKPTLNVGGKEDIESIKRATVEEVYQQVIADLKEAERLMPTMPLRRGRATSFAAAAYLARVYFQMNDFTNALVQINKVIGAIPGVIETEFKLVRSPATGTINASQAAANVAAAFKSSGTSVKVSENIFDFISLATSAVNGVMNRKYFRTGAINPHLAISNTYLTEAAFAANDARKVGMITTAGGVNYTKKYDQSVMNIPVIRSAELLLDRAEIFALQGNTADATKDINLIRDRAIPGYNINTVIAPDKIVEEVRRERIRELAFEGDRLHNLRRMQVNIGGGDRGSGATVAWNSNSLLFRFPQEEIRASNGGVVQNPD
jgi:tetratricopeptide (TPR) repeat protein